MDIKIPVIKFVRLIVSYEKVKRLTPCLLLYNLTRLVVFIISLAQIIY